MAKKQQSKGIKEAERRIAECLKQGDLQANLSLANLELTSLPEMLWQCKHLKQLDLNDNGFIWLDHRIGGFPQLEELYLTRNKIAELPEEIGGLFRLAELAVGGNQLTRLPDGLRRCGMLNTLYAWGNRFENFPAWIEELSSITVLSIGGNPLAQFPDSLGGMTRLMNLEIGGLGLRKLPGAIRRLGRLEYLYIHGNPIETLPDWLGDQSELRHLHARGCLLRTLPSGLVRCRRLRDVDVQDNAIEILPLELASSVDLRVDLDPGHLPSDWQAAWRSGEWPALREHMLKLAAARQSTQAAPAIACTGKLILVGYQENGKTCLQRALRGLPFESSHKSTHGMNRVQLSVRTDGSLLPEQERKQYLGPMPEVIDFQVWDMGGQDHYQHTHQMFFTPGAIYLAVMKPRAGGGFGKLRDWLALIQKRTKDRARVIVVSTFSTTAGTDESITLSSLQAEFPKIVEDIHVVDSEKDIGIHELRKKLADMIKGDQNFNHHWLPGWAETFDALGRLPDPYLKWDDLADVCSKQGVKDEKEQRILVSTGHIVGCLLWRNDTPAGEDVVVLNPDWLNGAVARLLDDEQTRKRHGLIEISDLKRVWAGEDREGKPGYNEAIYPLLITLMEANELAYRPKTKDGTHAHYELLLVTQMVQPGAPPDLESRWQTLKPQHGTEELRVFTFRKLNGTGNGHVQDLIYLLIFRLRSLSLGKSDHERSVHWQRGLMVQDEYGSVGRIELHDDEIRVRVCSHLCERLLSIINHEIGEKRDEEMWPGLEKTESLVCGAACPSGTPERGRIDFEECCQAHAEGNPKTRCRIADCGKWLKIEDILHAAPPSPQMQQIIDKMDKVEKAVLERDAATIQKIDEILDQGKAADAKLDTLLKDSKLTRELINTRIDEIILAIGDEGPRLFSARLKKKRFWETKGWTKTTYIVTLWCEKSRKPVPYFGEGERKTGQVEIELTREWVAKSIPWMKSAVKLALAYAVLGPLGLSAAQAAAGVAGMELAKSAAQADSGLLAQFAKEWEAELELLKTFDEGKVMDLSALDLSDARAFGKLRPFELQEFGTPFDKEDPFIPFIRDMYKAQDPSYGGLQRVFQTGLGWIWAHPHSGQLE